MARMRLPRTWFPETDGIFSRYSSAVSSRMGVRSPYIIITAGALFICR